MKITIEEYGKTYTTEWKLEGQGAAEVIKTFCEMMVLVGWSSNTIKDLFEDTTSENRSPLDWEICS